MATSYENTGAEVMHESDRSYADNYFYFKILEIFFALRTGSHILKSFALYQWGETRQYSLCGTEQAGCSSEEYISLPRMIKKRTHSLELTGIKC